MYEQDRLPAKDLVLSLKTKEIPRSVNLLANGNSLPFSYSEGLLSIELPATLRSDLVDVVAVQLTHR
jgi:alpha-L-fucosidase